MKSPKNKRFVVVSNRLPFYRKLDSKGNVIWKQSTGGLITAMDPVLRKTNGLWVGWDVSPYEDAKEQSFKLIDIKDIESEEETAEKEGSYSIGCIPVTHDEAEGYYNRLSNGTLWALFHYFFEKCSLDHASWDTYCQVNKRFAEYVHKLVKPDDVIWIQDFHLFMVPYYLRQLRPKQKIHFFLHIPFPHVDIFSILPWQDDIVKSLLCCDTVGFHHKRYRKNFLQAVDIYHKSNPETKLKTNVYVNPISIDFDRFDHTSRKVEVASRRDEIRKQILSKKLILGVDRLDYSKGIKERLKAIEFLIEKHPELKEQFTYYQLAIPSREDISAYKQLKKEVDGIIGHINGRFSTGTWTPIHYMYSSVTFDELIALYGAADIALITPLRDGMNIVCKEYIASHSDGDGILVLSKFAGAAADIKNCIPVNPYSIEEVATSIYQALKMKEPERRKRMQKMRRTIRTNNINHWLDKCLHIFNE